MDDMFAPLTKMEPGERSAREMAEGEAKARKMLLQRVTDNPAGIEWNSLWPAILDACVVTHAGLGDIARDLWSRGQVVVPEWQSKAIKRPKDEFRFNLSAEPQSTVR